MGISSALGKLGVCNLTPSQVMQKTGMSLLLLKQINVKDALTMLSLKPWDALLDGLNASASIAVKVLFNKGVLGFNLAVHNTLGTRKSSNHFSQLLVWVRSSHWFDELGQEMDDE